MLFWIHFSLLKKFEEIRTHTTPKHGKYDHTHDWFVIVNAIHDYMTM
jgi:hypothetical protein